MRREMQNIELSVGIFGGSAYAAEMLDLIHLRSKGTRVVGVHALGEEEPAARLAVRFGIPVFLEADSFYTALREKNAVLYNATPSHLHLGISQRAINAGLDVWLEKPPVTSIKAFESMEESILTSDQRVQVCFNNLYNPVLIAFRDALRKGWLGRVHEIHTVGGLVRSIDYFHRSRWAGKIKLDGMLVRDGSLSNALSHAVVNALFCGAANGKLLDDLVLTEIQMGRVVSPEAEDTVSFSGRGESGCLYTVNLSLALDEKIAPENRIVTDSGTFLFEDYQRIRGENLKTPSVFDAIEPQLIEHDVRLDMLAMMREATLGRQDGHVPFAATRPFVRLLEAAYGRYHNPVPILRKEGVSKPEIKPMIRKKLLDAYSTGTMMDLEPLTASPPVFVG